VRELKIDKINANIVKTLLNDARTSFTEMAKENKITAAAVRSRYENLKKAGVITGAIMQINPLRIGFRCFGFLGVKAHPARSAEVMEYLRKQHYILATWNKIQEINIGNFFAVSNLENFTEIHDKLRAHPHIKNVQPLIYVGLPYHNHPEKLVIKSNTEIIQQQNFGKKTANMLEQERAAKEQLKKPLSQTPELQRMSNIDRQIAKILSQNARTPFSVIAKELNISTSHAIKTYKKLIEKKYFLGSSITIDPRKLGYKANAMIYIKRSVATNITDFQKSILNVPNVITLVKTLGEWDKLAIIPLNTFEELFDIEKEFATIKGIKKIEVKINPPFAHWPFDFLAPHL
jgi:Lrp/AsnC family transcriptional regulator for asnA, asnC and gidA